MASWRDEPIEAVKSKGERGAEEAARHRKRVEEALATAETAISLGVEALRYTRDRLREKEQPVGRISVWVLLVWWLLVPAGAVTVAVAPLAAPPVLLALAILAIPWPFTRLVLIPLGLPRLSYWLTRASDATFRLDRHGGAAAAAAWALSMQRELDEESAQWLAEELAAQAPLRGAGVLAGGLLLAARGDLEGARALLGAVPEVDDFICPPEAKRIASGWLAADAAERGEWARVAELGQTLAQGGRLGWLLSAIAQSLLLEPMAPGKLDLWLRWALAPRRRATLPLVRRALEALDGTFIEPEEDAPLAPATPADGGDAIRIALSLHASVLTRPTTDLRPEDVRAAGQAWDTALFDRATERLLLERALVVGASSAAVVLARMRVAAEDDLTSVVLASGMPLGDLGNHGEVASRVRARLRDRLLAEVEVASDAIKRRVDKRALPDADEWREWGNLRAAYQRGVLRGGAELRRIAFAKVYPEACRYAVWLLNKQKRRPLGNAIFRWLLAEATALGDTRAMALMSKNVACDI